MRYEKIKQNNNYTCAPACLQMILKRNNIRYDTQEEIGYDLGLIVPEKDKHLFKKVRTGKKPIAGYGTQVQEEKYSINNYFIKNKIPLNYECQYIDDYERTKEFLFDNKNNDIMICLDYGVLYDKNYTGGHLVVIDNINNELVTLIDPYRDSNYETVQLEKIVAAIKKHGKEKAAGFWLIKKVWNIEKH